MKSRPGFLTRDNWPLQLELQAQATQAPPGWQLLGEKAESGSRLCQHSGGKTGQSPEKIDVSVGKIYILLPRQKGQVLQPTAGCGGSCSTSLSQLQLLLPERYGLNLPEYNAGNPGLASLSRV